MSTIYRQTIVVELEGETHETLRIARLKFESAMAELEEVLGKFKGSGRILAVMPAEVREWDRGVPTKKG